jgi:serine/alanine racemase
MASAAFVRHCLMGDSYFGAFSGVPVISTVYEARFHVFSYTRNGLYYAPVFLAMGAWLGHSAFCS